jgi:hypothetical protein
MMPRRTDVVRFEFDADHCSDVCACLRCVSFAFVRVSPRSGRQTKTCEPAAFNNSRRDNFLITHDESPKISERTVGAALRGRPA